MPDFPIALQDAGTLIGCSGQAIRLRIVAGDLPGAFKQKNERNRTSWYLTESDFELMTGFINAPGGRRSQFKRRQRGERVEYRCTKCEQWKHEDDFAGSAKRSCPWGKRSHCRECERAARRERNTDTARAKRVRKMNNKWFRERKKLVLSEGARLMRAYRNDPHIDGNRVFAELKAAFPGCEIAEMADALGVDHQVVRRCIDGMVTLAKADRLLTAAGRGHMLNEIAPPPGLPGWSRKYDRCQHPLCGTIEIHHVARGLCDHCYRWFSKGKEPLMRTGWSRFIDCCMACGTTEAPHLGRGLCIKCHRAAIKRGDLQKYPTLRRMSARDDSDTLGAWESSIDASTPEKAEH